jgi:hypothetical protein
MLWMTCSNAHAKHSRCAYSRLFVQPMKSSTKTSLRFVVGLVLVGILVGL